MDRLLGKNKDWHFAKSDRDDVYFTFNRLGEKTFALVVNYEEHPVTVELGFDLADGAYDVTAWTEGKGWRTRLADEDSPRAADLRRFILTLQPNQPMALCLAKR